MKKAIIYTRVSTNRQDTARQIADLKKWAKGNDYEVIRVFEDTTSGKTKAKDRTGAKEMFAFIESNKIDMVLTSEISRIGRTAINAQNVIDTIVNEYGLNLFIEQQGLTARNKKGEVNPVFKIVSDVLANVAQMENEIRTARIKSGLAEAKRKGKVLGRPEGSTKNNKNLLNEYKQVVRNLNDGQSIRKTAKICDVSAATVQKVKKAMN